VLREVFGDVAGFGADPAGLARELRRALAAPDPGRRLAGQALAARYTWRAAAQAHLALYRSLLG
jgi:hypothetical protein